MADTVNSRLEVWQLDGVELKDGLPDPTCLSWRPHLFALPRAIFRLVPQEDRGLSPSQGTLRSRGLPFLERDARLPTQQLLCKRNVRLALLRIILWQGP
jgi:hypothetical protein